MFYTSEVLIAAHFESDDVIKMKQDIKLKLKDLSIREILEKEVLKHGTGAHVCVPKRHLGKKVIIIVKEISDQSQVRTE